MVGIDGGRHIIREGVFMIRDPVTVHIIKAEENGQLRNGLKINNAG